MADERSPSCGHDDCHDDAQVVKEDDVDSVRDVDRVHGREDVEGWTTVSTIP